MGKFAQSLGGKGIRTIAPGENYPRLGLGFGVGLVIELGVNFPWWQLP